MNWGRIVLQIVHGGAHAYSVSIWGGDYMAVSDFDEMQSCGKSAVLSQNRDAVVLPLPGIVPFKTA